MAPFSLRGSHDHRQEGVIRREAPHCRQCGSQNLSAVRDFEIGPDKEKDAAEPWMQHRKHTGRRALTLTCHDCGNTVTVAIDKGEGPMNHPMDNIPGEPWSQAMVSEPLGAQQECGACGHPAHEAGDCPEYKRMIAQAAAAMLGDREPYEPSVYNGDDNSDPGFYE